MSACVGGWLGAPLATSLPSLLSTPSAFLLQCLFRLHIPWTFANDGMEPHSVCRRCAKAGTCGDDDKCDLRLIPLSSDVHAMLGDCSLMPHCIFNHGSNTLPLQENSDMLCRTAALTAQVAP